MTVFERQIAARTLVHVGDSVKRLVYFNKCVKGAHARITRVIDDGQQYATKITTFTVFLHSSYHIVV